jgi:hypothetical protein
MGAIPPEPFQADRISRELQEGHDGREQPSHENASPHSLQQHAGHAGSRMEITKNASCVFMDKTFPELWSAGK